MGSTPRSDSNPGMRIGNLGLNLVCLNVYDRHRVVHCIRNKDLVCSSHDAGRAAATVAFFSERDAGPNERYQFGFCRLGNIDYADRVRFIRIGITQARYLHRAELRLSLHAGRSFRAGKAKRGEIQSGFFRLPRIGARYGMVLEHSDVRDVKSSMVGGKRHCERQPANTDRGQNLAGFCIDYSHPKIRLVQDIEDSAGRVERQIARIAVHKALLVQVDYPATFVVPLE